MISTADGFYDNVRHRSVFFLSHRLKVANAEIAKSSPQEGKVNNITNLLAITEILAGDSATDSR